jgi:hypothetical protein
VSPAAIWPTTTLSGTLDPAIAGRPDRMAGSATAWGARTVAAMGWKLAPAFGPGSLPRLSFPLLTRKRRRHATNLTWRVNAANSLKRLAFTIPSDPLGSPSMVNKLPTAILPEIW